MKLNEWRKEIDSIDGQITELIRQRMCIARKIGILKTKAGLPIVDLEREEEILRRLTHKSENQNESESMIRIYRHILIESRKIQDETSRKILEKGVEIR